MMATISDALESGSEIWMQVHMNHRACILIYAAAPRFLGKVEVDPRQKSNAACILVIKNVSPSMTAPIMNIRAPGQTHRSEFKQTHRFRRNSLLILADPQDTNTAQFESSTVGFW